MELARERDRIGLRLGNYRFLDGSFNVNHTSTVSPQVYARTGGALYLMLIVLGIFGEAVRDTLIVSDNAAATAANIRSMESLWRFGITSEFVSLIGATSLAMIYFVLLRPVNEQLNLLATFLRLVAITIEAVAALNLVAALFPLGTAESLKAFTPEQLYALTRLAIVSHSHGYGLALLFFGFCFLFHGYLIFRSGFLPKARGPDSGCRSVLHDEQLRAVSGSRLRKSYISRNSSALLRWGVVGLPLASCERGQR
jgi:hypothetical protein